MPTEPDELKAAFDRNDLKRVIALMNANPTLHQATLGTHGEAALTYAAKCRNPVDLRSPMSARQESEIRKRLEIADWMIANGSDVHQGNEAPLNAAWTCPQMMELLISRGADVNARPIIFVACENLEPEPLKCLLDHGANPNCERLGRAETPLDLVFTTYVRRPADLKECIEMLLEAGATTHYDIPIFLDILRGRVDEVAKQFTLDPSLVDARFHNLDFLAMTGGRLLPLRGVTPLHIAAEYCVPEVALALLDRGADVNARASVDDKGVGGQTAVFHAATQFGDLGLPITRLLVEHGADLTVRARLPGRYDRPNEVVEGTPLGYAIRFRDSAWYGEKSKTIAFLRNHQAPE